MRAKPNSCLDCPCYSMGTDFSSVTGTGSLGVMVVAEASGEHEQREQRSLVEYALAGSLLERTFRRMGYSREQFSLTNCIRCRPRNNWLSGAPYEYSALSHCRPNLDAAIRDRRPRAILALGDTALRELTGEAGEARGVGHLAGYVLHGPNDIPTIGAFHPAFIRRGAAHLQGVFARNLQRAVNVAAGKDREWLWGIDPQDRSTHGQLDYTTHPSLDDARSFVRRVEDSPNLPLSYDIETVESASLDEDARDGFSDTRIRLIQFSIGGGSGIAFPWEGAYREEARRLLQTSNVKCGHNVWTFDNRVLEATGEREGLDLRPRGPIHDTMCMFGHWQPDLPKHLQFAAQFIQFPFPWKHLAATDLEFYGCVDVDATLRLYHFLVAQLQRDGIWDSANGVGGYVGQVQEVRPILAAMERRGLPVDDAERLKLDAEFDLAQKELGSELDGRFPDEARSIHPKQGYKKTPKDTTGLVLHPFKIALVEEGTGELGESSVERWCRLEPFSPNSWQQLLRYMDAKHHKRPKSRKAENEDGSPKDTTDKKELVRLAHRTGDNFYLKVIEYRELGKARGTYIEGFKPHEDGCVHGTFTFDTGTGQISSRNPNTTNIPKRARLAKAIRRMFTAPPGRVIVEWDYKSYHVLTTGYCAEDASYMRMARLDMHSFVAGCFLNLWQPNIIEEPDDALLERFSWFKSDPERKRVRDNQAKASILGIGFGMGYRRLYQENMEHFEGEKMAKRLHDLLHSLFPKVFAWQDRIRQQAHEQTYLKSPFGHIRRFYEVFRWDYKKAAWAPGDQAEEAVAFLPANIAFGNIRWTMKELERLELNQRYRLSNTIHDSMVFYPQRAELNRHIEEVYPILTAPSRILVNPVVAPAGLTVDVEGAVGENWSDMHEVNVKEAVYATTTVS